MNKIFENIEKPDLLLGVLTAIAAVIHLTGLGLLLMIFAFTWSVESVYAALDYYLAYLGLGIIVSGVILLFSMGKGQDYE